MKFVYLNTNVSLYYQGDINIKILQSSQVIKHEIAKPSLLYLQMLCLGIRFWGDRRFTSHRWEIDHTPIFSLTFWQPSNIQPHTYAY